MQGRAGQDRVLVLFGQEAVQVDDAVQAVVVDALGQGVLSGPRPTTWTRRPGWRVRSSAAASTMRVTRFCTTRRPRETIAGSPRSGRAGGDAGCPGPPLWMTVMGARQRSFSRMARREDSETVTVGQEA